MKFLAALIKMQILTALMVIIACGSASKQPDTAITKTDRHRKIATLMVQKNIKDHSENHSMRWYESQSTDTTRGVALVIHGLNLRPSKMESIINILTDSGIDALNLSLRGHGENYDRHAHKDPARARLAAFKSVSYGLWMDEICAAYYAARNRSADKQAPLFFIGFSLGGLMGADLLVSSPDIHFDRMVLFAPAIKMHLRNYMIRVLSPFPRLTIPSFTLASYQSNDGTPMAGYNALFDSLNSFAGNTGPNANVPTLVFIDQKDEIVSYNRLKQMVQDENLDQWQFYIVQKESSKEPAKIHHLIIDAASTGENVWKDMMQAMINHLYHQNLSHDAFLS
jgi:alpha-beta hydrolase superfamily lysophospholipase